MQTKIRRVLVTGGAGFIGSWIVDALLTERYRVTILDSLAPPTHNAKLPPWVSRKATFVRGDIRKKADWLRALKGVDAVIHLGARMDYHLDFSSYVDTNIKSITLLFELIAEKKAHFKHLIFASSQAVYGEGPYRCAKHALVFPSPRSGTQLSKGEWDHRCPVCNRAVKPVLQREDQELYPTNPYGISKLSSEQFAFTLGNTFDVPVTAMRYSIALGPRQSFRHFYSGALRSFTVDALSGRDIVMHEDGMQLRDFVDVRDVARAHVLALGNPHAAGQAFNIGSGKQTHIVDFARLVAKKANAEFRPSLNARYRVGASRHGIMDVSKIKKLLHWEAKIPLEKTVQDYITWLSSQPDSRHYFEATNRDMQKKGLIKTIG